MSKIKEILIGTNNQGKYKEICHLLPNKIKKYSLSEFDIRAPEETGKSFEENSYIKASYFSKHTNLICLSDDSGLEIDLLDGGPGIYSSRWGGKKKDFNLAIEKVYKEMKNFSKDWKQKNLAKFICSLTIFWPGGKSITRTGKVNGKISIKKKGTKGFGYDPIFIPNGYNQTFGQMQPKFKISIDHRKKAFTRLKNFF